MIGRLFEPRLHRSGTHPGNTGNPTQCHINGMLVHSSLNQDYSVLTLIPAILETLRQFHIDRMLVHSIRETLWLVHSIRETLWFVRWWNKHSGTMHLKHHPCHFDWLMSTTETSSKNETGLGWPMLYCSDACPVNTRNPVDSTVVETGLGFDQVWSIAHKFEKTQQVLSNLNYETTAT